jgi:hypothetical protein
VTPLILAVATLALLVILNQTADRLRHRVSIERSPQRLAIRNQRAAVRLDGTMLFILLLGLGYGLIARSAVLLVLSAASAAMVGWRIYAASRAPVFVFDRSVNAVLKNESSICSLAAIEGLHVTGQQPAALQLRHRAQGGALREQELYRGQSAQVAEVRRAIVDFLASPAP